MSAPKTPPLAYALVGPLQNVHRISRNNGLATIGDLMTNLGGRADLLACVLLPIPFIVWPLSLGPITAPVSVFMFVLGIRLWTGKTGVPLPAKWMDLGLPQAFLNIIRRSVAYLARWRSLERKLPEIQVLSKDLQVKAAVAGILVGAVLLAVPIPLLPLTNTFPALGIALCSIAVLKRSDLFLVLAVISYVISLVIFLIAVLFGAAILAFIWSIIQDWEIIKYLAKFEVIKYLFTPEED